MTPPPVPVGMVLCELVIVDHQSRNPSVISRFTGLAVDGFPSPPQRFSVFATLTNGRGNATVKLVGSRLDTGETIYEQQYPISFPDH